MEWKSRKLLFHYDNMAVVDAWKSGTCKNKIAMRLIRRMLACAAKYNFILYIQHIAGVDNTLADLLSLSCRCSSSGSEIQLPTRTRWPSNTCHLDSKVVELIENSVAASPVRTLHLGITTYHQFCSRYGIPLLSPTLQHIGVFVAALMGSRSLSTIRVYVGHPLLPAV